MTKQDICKFFGCTLEQVNNQYKANADGLSKMHQRALISGKKVNGYTADQLEQMTNKYTELAQN